MLSLIMSIVQLVLFAARWLEHRGKVNDARKAVELDVRRLAKKFQERADTARAAVDNNPDSVLNDPDNRDTRPDRLT